MTTYRHGEQLKVKRMPWTVRAHGTSDHNDYIISTGEVGIVTRILYTAHDGSPMASWSLVFSRGRRINMTVPEGADYASSEVAVFYSDDEKQFARVSPAKTPEAKREAKNQEEGTRMTIEIETIYSSEPYTHEAAERHGIKTDGMTWGQIIDAIEEWEEEFCS